MKTVKDYLKEVDKVSLISAVVDFHKQCSWDDLDADATTNLIEGYTSVYMRLVEFGEWTWFRSKYKVSAHVNDPIPGFDDDEDEPFLNLSLLNKNFQNPPEGLKMWGGNYKDKDDSPEGHYNVNYEDYSKFFAIDFMPWRVTVNLELDIDESASHYSIIDILAGYIYEVTFNGFQERSYMSMKKDLKERCESIKENSIPYEEVMKELNDYLEDRKAVEPQKEGDMKIRFSKEAVEDLKKMIDKSVDSDNV